MTADEVWLYVNSETGNISVHDTRGAVEAAAADDQAPWIELVTENDFEPAPTPRRVWMAPPVLTVHGTSFYNPWSDEDDAA